MVSCILDYLIYQICCLLSWIRTIVENNKGLIGDKQILQPNPNNVLGLIGDLAKFDIMNLIDRII